MSVTTTKTDQTRRNFIRLGAALLGTAAASSTAHADDKTEAKTPRKRPAQGIDFEKWKKLKGEAYPQGTENTPGVCELPGPNAKRNWPDKNKYVDTKQIPGMCQLCSTICGIIGHVKNNRLIKIEGNPKDPNSRGRLCARGQAGLNHQYHPERLLYPLKRVGKRGEGKWKRISWEDALDEIAEN